MIVHVALALMTLIIPAAYGHGLGVDSLDVSIEGTNTRITAQMPTQFDDASKRLGISVSQSGEGIDAVLRVAVEHLDRQVINGTFHAPQGSLYFDIISTSGEYVQMISPGMVDISGPLFESGGLYTIRVSVESLGGLAVSEPKTHTLDLLVRDSAAHASMDMEGALTNFTTVSYFDQIGGFEYDAASGVVEFWMPFDWSVDRVSHIPVLHQEVHFPMNFEEFVTRGYTGKINGVDLFRSSVTVDDFSVPGERTVHFVLLQDHINLVRSQQARTGTPLPDTITFTLTKTLDVRTQMSAFTRNGDYQVDMTWEPEQVLPEQDTKFIFTIRDAYTGETLRNSEYDFVLEQDGRELYRSSGTARVGGDFQEYEFTQEDAGAALVRIENIRGTDQYVEFAFVVAPEFGIVMVMLAVSLGVIITVLRAGPFRGMYVR